MYDYQIICNRLIRFFPYLTLVHLIVSRLHRQIHRKTCVVYSSMAVYVTSKNSIWLQLYYRRQAKFAKVKVFTSVCPGGGSASRGWGCLHPGGLHSEGGLSRPLPIGYYGIWSKSGRYASYWNAFLLSECSPHGFFFFCINC